jgi:hypothetical protein
MARRRDFGSPAVNPDAEPVEFDLHGETFHCVPEIQGAVLLDLVEAAEGEGSQQAAVLSRALKAALVEESAERFAALTHSKDKHVPLEALGEIAAWLIETYAGGERPEEEPDQS